MILCRTEGRRGIGTAAAMMVLVTIIVVSAIAVAALTGMAGSSSATAAGTTTTSALASTGAASGEVFYAQVVNESSNMPIAGEQVVAGQTPSPNDIARTPGGPTLTQCVNPAPGSCPLSGYTTNATGWVSITNVTGSFFFIKAGNVNEWNDMVFGVTANKTVIITIPLPGGNVTIPSDEQTCGLSQANSTTATITCTEIPGIPVIWPNTTIVWPCYQGLPSGSAVVPQWLGVPQGFDGVAVISYSYAVLPNGTDAALNSYCPGWGSPPTVAPLPPVVWAGSLVVRANGTGTLELTARNLAAGDVTSIIVQPNSTTLSLDGAAPGSPWTMVSGASIPVGSTFSSNITISVPGRELVAGTTYIFTVTVTFEGGGTNVQTMTLSAVYW